MKLRRAEEFSATNYYSLEVNQNLIDDIQQYLTRFQLDGQPIMNVTVTPEMIAELFANQGDSDTCDYLNTRHQVAHNNGINHWTSSIGNLIYDYLNDAVWDCLDDTDYWDANNIKDTVDYDE